MISSLFSHSRSPRVDPAPRFALGLLALFILLPLFFGSLRAQTPTSDAERDGLRGRVRGVWSGYVERTGDRTDTAFYTYREYLPDGSLWQRRGRIVDVESFGERDGGAPKWHTSSYYYGSDGALVEIRDTSDVLYSIPPFTTHHICMVYDAAGRLVEEQGYWYPIGFQAETKRYYYDRDGAVVAIVEMSHTMAGATTTDRVTNFLRDSAGRTLKIIGEVEGNGLDVCTTQVYGRSGRIVEQQEEHVDANGMLRDITIIEYDSLGNERSARYESFIRRRMAGRWWRYYTVTAADIAGNWLARRKDMLSIRNGRARAETQEDAVRRITYYDKPMGETR